MKRINFKIEEIVYLKTDPELLPRIITRYQVSKGSVVYELGCGAGTSWHYEFEFVRIKDELNKQIGFNKDANL